MQIIKKFNNGDFKFDNLESKKTKFKVKMVDDEIEINFMKIIDSQFSEGNLKNDKQFMKDFLKVGLYSKAPCGGFVNFYQIVSLNGKKFIIYSGVNEVSNSHYIVTIHEIII